MSPRILFTASTYSHIRNFHLPYLRAFRRLGWTVHVGCGGSVGDFPEMDCVIKLPFKKKLTAASNFKAMEILRCAIKENHYDLICTHTSLAAFFTRLAVGAISPRPPVVTVVHGYLFRERPVSLSDHLLLLAEKLVSRQTDLLLTMNRKDFVSATKNQLCKRIMEIPGMGVNFSLQDQVTEAEVKKLRASLQFKDSDFLLLYPAEFSSRKNQGMLIRALSQLPAGVRLILPGEGALLEHCRTLAEELGVGDRTLFPGQVSNLPIWYATVDAAVSSSRSEGLPFSVMEAMYAGLPVVVSEIKGHIDLVDDGRSGLLYPRDDIDGFIEKIMHLMDDPVLACRLGRVARNQVAPYALDRVLPQVMELYLSAVSGTE